MSENTHTTALYPVHSKDPLAGNHLETAKFLWKTYVPKAGQAETVQGELIRIVEKLDHEIMGNAKANWDQDFVKLGRYLRDTLIRSGVFPVEIQAEIKQDVNKLIRGKNTLCWEEDVYERLRRRVVEWYWRNEEPIRHQYNPEITR